MKDLLLGLGELGFDTIDDMPIFKAAPVVVVTTQAAEKPITVEDCVFDKSYKCPVCDKSFKEKTLKTSKAKFMGSDLDLMPTYTPVYPFFYNVVLCASCGYTALTENFMTITDNQCGLIQKNITPKFKPKKYKIPFSEKDAIERLKLALLNSFVKNGKASEKAYICLAISWLYKLCDDSYNRLLFASNAYDFFVEAYTKDSFPIYGMSEYVTSYLLGELARITGNYEAATQWVTVVLSSRSAPPKIKDMTLDLKIRLQERKP